MSVERPSRDEPSGWFAAMIKNGLTELGQRFVGDMQARGFDDAAEICLAPIEARIDDLHAQQRLGKLKSNDQIWLSKLIDLRTEIENDLRAAGEGQSVRDGS